MKKLMLGAITAILCGGKGKRSVGPVTLTFREPKTAIEFGARKMLELTLKEKNQLAITLSEFAGWVTLVTNFKNADDAENFFNSMDDLPRQVAA